MDQNPNTSTTDQFDFKRFRLTHLAAAVAGGTLVALYFTKYSNTVVCCNISPEMLKRAQESRELLLFGNKRAKAIVSLTRNV